MMCRRLYILILILGCCNIADAQSYFYNAQQYGLKSTLLGGSMIAGNDDLSMVYYNPAALCYSRGKGFDVALIVPTYSFYNYGHFFNEDQDSKNTDFNLSPRLLTYKTHIYGDFDIVLTILEKDSWDNGFSFTTKSSTENGSVSKSLHYDFEGSDKWIGVGSHKQFGKYFSVGLSQFWSTNKTSYEYRVSQETLNLDNQQVDFFSEDLSLRYSSNFSMLTKLGIAACTKFDRFGLVISSPRYLPWTRNARFEKTSTHLTPDNHSADEIIDYGLNPRIEDSWEINFGYGRIFRDSTEIYVSASYHSELKPYNIFQVIDETQENIALVTEAKSVINFSVGVSRKIGGRTYFLGSFRTNYLANENKARTAQIERIQILESDRFQIASGLKIDYKKSSIVLGLDYGFSKAKNDNLFKHFPYISEFETNTNTDYTFNSFTFLLTYEFFLDTAQKTISKMLDK